MITTNIFRKYGNWILFAVLTLVILSKIAMFQYFTFHSILLSSLWKSPAAFFAFWLKKIAISALLTSLVFIVKNRWWTLPMLVVIDLWILANYIYYRANGLLLTIDTMLIVDNMQGFWSSVLVYLNWQACMFPLTTFLWCVVLILINKIVAVRSWIGWGASLATVLVLWICGGVASYKIEYKFTAGEIGMSAETNKVLWKNALIPLAEVKQVTTFRILEDGMIKEEKYERFLRDHDVISYFPEILMIYHCQQSIANGSFDLSEGITLNQQDKKDFNLLYCADIEQNRGGAIGKNLIVFCVESLEDWVLDMCDVRGREVAPNLRRFADDQASLYASKISSQARYGNSGDGQMLMITGLLPISYGSAAMYFGENVYPSWAQVYENDMVINPSPLAWNIDVTTPSYGFRELVQPEDKRIFWDDASVTDELRNAVDTLTEPFAVFAITETMHGPYLKIPYNPEVMEFDSDMPTHMRNYLTCVHYTDSCIGAFLDYYLQTDKAENTVIVITGDHTTFKPVYNTDRERTTPTEMCYQMDIYPTIMSCIGLTDYPWKGFGTDLYGDTLVRPMSEERAYELSNKLIRTNYFSQ